MSEEYGAAHKNWALGFRLGTAPPPLSNSLESILGVLLRAIYNDIISIIQLLLRGCSTQGLGFRVSGLDVVFALDDCHLLWLPQGKHDQCDKLIGQQFPKP